MDSKQIEINLQNLKIPPTIKLIAVSKKKPSSLIQMAYNAGQRNFGENYAQEGVEKIQNLKDFADIQWHFIGHIQSNKVDLIAKHFQYIHSIDRLKIAKKLNDACQKYNKILPVLIEINIGTESQKAGIQPDQIQELAEFITTCKNLKWNGFMCIPPFDKDPEHYFSKMQKIFESYKATYGISELSMGMSSDYQLAIQYGATMVRIGTSIFGLRK